MSERSYNPAATTQSFLPEIPKINGADFSQFGGTLKMPSAKLPSLGTSNLTGDLWAGMGNTGGSADLNSVGDMSLFNKDYASSDKGFLAGMPELAGKWKPVTDLGMGVAKVGLDAYNAMEQSKMNDFMKSYYGDQMARDTADFENNARSANAALSNQQQSILGAQGYSSNDPEGQAKLAEYMNKWGAKETVA